MAVKAMLEGDSYGPEEYVLRHLTAERLAQLIQRVRQNPSHRDKARYFHKVIARTHGLDVAANAIERAFNGTDKIVRGSSTDLSMSSNLAPQ